VGGWGAAAWAVGRLVRNHTALTACRAELGHYQG